MLKFSVNNRINPLSFRVIHKAISQKVSVGGQPRVFDLEELRKNGVKTVVNLRVTGENSPLTPVEERVLAERLGFQYHHLPLSLDDPTPAQVKELREILQNSQGPVYVHCGMGQRACSISLAASGVEADSIFERSQPGFPVEDERLAAFLRSLGK
jgi:uncharacterized protein (TIGR01244 family)